MKHLRKFSVLLLTIIMVLSTQIVPASASISAQSNYQQTLDALDIQTLSESAILDTEVLYSLNDSPDYLLTTFTNGGYTISLQSTGTIIEYHPTASSPYLNVDGEYYYAGPLNYVYKNADTFYLVHGDEEVPSTSVNNILLNLQTAAEKNEARSSSTSPYSSNAEAYSIDHTTAIQTMDFGCNVNGTCGSIASGIVLQYLDTYHDSSIIVEDSFLFYGEPLHLELTNFIEFGGGSVSGGSMVHSIASGINDWVFAESDCHELTAHYMYLLYNNYVRDSIADDKPCIVSMPDMIVSNPFGAHVVVAYQYSDFGSDIFYTCHVGYHDFANATEYGINADWADGVCYLEFE